MNLPPLSDIDHRFRYHPPRDEETKDAHAFVRGELGGAAVELERRLPPGREKALAITKLEEAMFWANAAIARGQ